MRCWELHLSNEPWPRDPDVSSCVCSLGYCACSPFVFYSPSLTNSDFRLWNVKWQKRYRMLVSSGQMRWVQLLLDRLKERVHSREGVSLNNFSLSTSLPFHHNAKRGPFICQCLLHYSQNNDRQNQQVNCNFSIDLFPSLPASSSHISGSLPVSSISDSVEEVRKWLPFRTVWADFLVHEHTLP